MSTLRRKLITVLAVLFCALLLLSAGILYKSDSAVAMTTTDTVSIGSGEDLVQKGLVKKTVLADLFAKLTGESNANLSTVTNYANTAPNASGGNGVYNGLTSEQLRSKNGGKDLIIKFGGLNWTVVYLSLDKSNEPVATLWLTDSSQLGTDGLSKWTYNWYTKDTAGTDLKYPSNMYSTSYVRSSLNLGTPYSYYNTLSTGDTWSGITNSKLFLQKTTKNASHPLAPFTMTAAELSSSPTVYSLKHLLDTPSQISWQETQSFAKMMPTNTINQNTINCCWGVPILGGGSGVNARGFYNKNGINFDYNSYSMVDGTFTDNNPKGSASDGSLYESWAYDTVWLPSIVEVPWQSTASNSFSNTSTDNGMLWRCSVNQRTNTGTSTGEENYIWLRSCGMSNTGYAQALKGNGSLSNSSYNVCDKRSVRPAIHLNLAKAMVLAPEDVETTYTGTERTIHNIYTDAPEDIQWYNNTVYPDSAGCVTYSYKKTVLNVGTYEEVVTMTITSDAADFGYKWASPDVANGKTKTIKIKVKKKPVKVRFTGSGGVISGDYSVTTAEDGTNYPVAEYLDGEIATNDKTGENAKNYPTLAVKYKDSAGKTYDTYPTQAGHYRAIAEITAENSNYVLYPEEDGYKNYIDFVITPEVVAQPMLSYGADLTYDGTGHKIDIVNYSSHIKYTVKKDGVVMTDKENLTDKSFEVVNAGTYTVTFAIIDEDKPYYAWDDSVGANDSLNNAPFDATPFTVQQAELTISFEGIDNPDSVNFSGGAWGVKTQVKFKVSVVGEVNGESVKLYLSYSDKDGNNKKSVGAQDDYYIIPEISEKGDYKLLCELASSTANPENANYKIKSGAEKEFKITNSKIDISDVTWFYVNSQIGSGTPQSFGDKNEVRYNGSAYTLTIDTNLPDHVIIDTSKGANGYLSNEQTNYSAGEYTTTVYLTTNDSNYELSKTSFEIKWKIGKGLYDLSGVTWSYTAPFTYDPVNHTTYTVSLNIPDDLKAKGLSYMWSQDGSDNSSSVAGTFTAKIILTTSDDNYETPVNGQSDTYIYNGTKGFPWELEWVVEKYTQNFEWQTGANGTLTENGNHESFYLPKVIDPDGMVTVKYYKKGDFDDNTKQPVAGAQPVDPDDMIVATSQEQAEAEGTYYAVLEFVGQYALNYKFGTGAYVKFNTFDTRQTLVVSISKAEYDYDGNPHADFATEVTILYATQSDIANYIVYEYFKIPASGGAPVSLGTTAPKNAGTYKIKISLNEAGDSIFVINGESEFTYTIKTLVLKAPSIDGELTYNGQDRDVAELVGIPDGWENYIDVTIIRVGSGLVTGSTVKETGTYNVTFKIKDGVNVAGSVNSVEWDINNLDKTITQTVIIKINQLVLNAQGWNGNGYYSTMNFSEEGAAQFVVYKVMDADGHEVDEGTVYSSIGEMFVVKVSVGEEHGDNVIIKFEPGVSDEFEFYTDGGEEPVQVTLPTIADLVFNGENQTFVIDYGGFEDYIEIDTSLSNPSALAQFNAGEYEIYFKIKRGVNAVWAGTGGRDSIAVTFKMKELVLDNPQIDANQKFTYTGSEITAVLNIDGAILARFLDVDGEISAINAGDYTFTLAIKESFAGNVVWASEGEKKVEWTIEKAKIGVKWTDGKVPELDLPDEFTGLEVEYIFTDGDGKTVSRDGLKDGKYTVTAKLKDEDNFEFVDDSGKVLTNPAMTEGYEFKYVEDDLANERQAAREELEKSAAAKYEEIEKSDMSDEEKAAAKAEVDAELAKGLENIAGAKDESELNSVTSTSKTKIEEIKVGSGSSFPWWIIAVAAGALLLILALVIIVVKKRQTADGDDEFDDYYGDDYDYDEEEEIDDFDDEDF